MRNANSPAVMDNYRVVGAFDTETTNIGVFGGGEAFPILYQYGHVDEVEQLTPDNAAELITVSIARHEQDIYKYFNAEIERAVGYVPVILVHNLGFDMYALAPYLLAHDVRVLAKTAKKPISFQIMNDKKPALVFLDTLGLFMKSLKTLGEECGMPKAVGDWDYNLVRTPETPLTEGELHYAKQDIYTLLVYMSYFLAKNPDIKQSDIGCRVQTKTGVVRAKRMVHVGNAVRKGARNTVREYWHLLNQSQKPKTDDELFTMHAATRGGFTFCAKNNASKVFFADDDHAITNFDSTSQHPAQMCSHLVPQNFTEATQQQMQLAFEICGCITLRRVLDSWLKPFPYAFYGSFYFENLRPKQDTVFDREGIYPLASARLGGASELFDNESSSGFRDHSRTKGYADSATGAVCNFGKLERCDSCVLYLTELDAWIVSRCYEWDNVEAVSGYITSTFRKAPDMAVLSVMRYYSAKNVLKEFMAVYKPGQAHDVKSIESYYPETFVNRCKSGLAELSELKDYYALSKADLNSLFGIEATNECRRDYELSGDDGFVLVGEDGLQNMPRSCKAFYQFGQRIVGWSRVAQVVIMEMVAPYADHIICGDTDSIKIYYKRENLGHIEQALSRHARCLDKAKRAACARAKAGYGKLYDKLPGIGHYVVDDQYDAFSASWNKSYIALQNGKCHMTVAGVPTSRSIDDKGSFNDFCDDLIAQGMKFDDVASLVIGYNVTIGDSITKLNARIHPRTFGGRVRREVTDYHGNTSFVDTPAALALFPNVKTLGDTNNRENATNMRIAQVNNPMVNTSPVWLRWDNGKASIER